MQIGQDIGIPPIRQDLQVFQGGYDFDGAPTWMLYDPLSDNYFKIGWFEFECLQRFGQYQSGLQVVSAIKRETTLDPDLDDIKEFIGFLLYNKLLRANSKEIQKILYDEKEKREEGNSILKKIFGQYLYITIPLIQPEKILTKTYPYIEKVFTKQFLWFILSLLGVGIFLTIQRWDDFTNTFTLFFSLQGIVCLILSTIFVKSIHELGHAFMAYKYKVPISTMGVVLIFMYPVLYTETTNVWRLYNRKKRINIAAAGLMAELMLASFFLILWHILSPGLLQNTAYFIAFVSLGLSFFVNMNCFMKFDGYYILSDIVGIDNLQGRATAFFKWRLREIILSLRHETPEMVSPKVERFLTYFGFFLSIYRVSLYTGIALVAFHVIFRPLGFFVMIAVLAWFLGIPILKELIVWYNEKEQFIKSKKTKIIGLFVAFILILAFLPIHRTIKVPVVAHAENHLSIYPNFPAEIESIYVKNGQNVQKDDLLFTLSSQYLDHEIERAEYNLALYKKVRERQQAVPELSSRAVDIEQIILETQTRLKGLGDQKEKLNIRAPFDGIIRDIAPEIHTGRTVNQKMLLGRVINQDQLFFTGYVREQNINRIQENAQGKFFPDTSFGGILDVQLFEVSNNNTKSIAYSELSTMFGGAIPSEFSGSDQAKILAKVPIYTLNFKITEQYKEKMPFVKKGTIKIKGQPISFIGQSFKKLISLFIRESGV